MYIRNVFLDVFHLFLTQCHAFFGLLMMFPKIYKDEAKSVIKNIILGRKKMGNQCFLASPYAFLCPKVEKECVFRCLCTCFERIVMHFSTSNDLLQRYTMMNAKSVIKNMLFGKKKDGKSSFFSKSACCLVPKVIEGICF